MKPKLKVLVIGGSGSSHSTLLDVLHSIKEVQVVEHISSGTEAINRHSEICPDLILIDILTDGISGLETARWIKEQNPSVKIILLSTEFNKEFLSAVMTMGFDGYLIKDITKKLLTEALKSLGDGQNYFMTNPKELN